MALAQSEPAQEHECETIGNVAESIMTTRQRNAQLSKVLAAIKPTLDAMPEWAGTMLRAALMDAYERPLYSTPEYKAQEVMRFRNDWELKCFKERG